MNYSSDKPLSGKKDDKLQRYPFAKRIADSILNYKAKDCIVIGIYGEWGEGKSTVLAFIEEELSRHSHILVIKFNPWRFKDENTLLSQFFNKLANQIETKVVGLDNNEEWWQFQFSKKKLKKSIQNISEKLKRYGATLSQIPYIGMAIKDISEGVNQSFREDVEGLREETEGLMSQFPGRITVLIDDIDRLDKDEIFSLFRLVKLSANFPNITYVLSFDVDMVASALGNRFGAGDENAGYSFIEKIIQIPLKIPAAQKNVLKEYLFSLLNNTIHSLDLSVERSDNNRFDQAFDVAFLPRLTTPRLAIRYANSVSFILPLLKDEVNIADLLLLEGLKIFYPSVYDLVRSNRHYFINSYRMYISDEIDATKAASLKTQLNNSLKNLDEVEKGAVFTLLQNLFPVVQEGLDNIKIEKSKYENGFKEKHVYSPIYFERYFSYTVPKGDISDVAFGKFIISSYKEDLKSINYQISALVSNSSPEAFLQKIKNVQLPINWESTVNLTKSISLNSKLFPTDNLEEELMPFDSLMTEAVRFVIDLLNKSKNLGDAYSLTLELLETSQSLDFAYQLFRWLDGFEMQGTELFTETQLRELGQRVVIRAMNESEHKSIFVIQPPVKAAKIYNLFSAINNASALKYLEDIVQGDAKQVLIILKTFTPIGRSTLYDDKYYHIDFAQNQYNYLRDILNINVDLLYEKILSAFPEANQGDAIFHNNMFNKNESDENILRQFLHWYNGDGSRPIYSRR